MDINLISTGALRTYIGIDRLWQIERFDRYVLEAVTVVDRKEFTVLCIQLLYTILVTANTVYSR